MNTSLIKPHVSDHDEIEALQELFTEQPSDDMEVPLFNSNSNVIKLLSKLQLLSITAPRNVVDVSLTVCGCVKSIMVMVVTNCSIEMYLNGHQPEPIIHINFDVTDDKAEEYLVTAISTVKELMLKHKNQNMDAA